MGIISSRVDKLQNKFLLFCGMIGDGHEEAVSLDGPFDSITLFLSNCKSEDQSYSAQEIDQAWTAKLNAQNEQKTPKRSGIHAQWSPSLETPKTGLSSIDARMTRIAVTSPGLFNSPLQQPNLLPSEEDDSLFLPCPNDMLAFTTGSGKRISSPSKEAKTKSKSIIEQVRLEFEEKSEPLMANDQEISNAPHFVGFVTGSGKKIQAPSIQSTPKTRLLVDECKAQPSPKQARLHVSIDTKLTSSQNAKILWEDGLKCSPCQDPEMALLSGV